MGIPNPTADAASQSAKDKRLARGTAQNTLHLTSAPAPEIIVGRPQARRCTSNRWSPDVNIGAFSVLGHGRPGGERQARSVKRADGAPTGRRLWAPTPRFGNQNRPPAAESPLVAFCSAVTKV